MELKLVRCEDYSETVDGIRTGLDCALHGLIHVYENRKLDCVFVCDRMLDEIKFEDFMVSVMRWLDDQSYKWYDLVDETWDYCPLDSEKELEILRASGDFNEKRLVEIEKDRENRNWKYLRTEIHEYVSVVVLDVDASVCVF